MKLAYVPNARDLTIVEKRKRATDNRKTIEDLGFDVEEVDLLNIAGQKLKEKLATKDVLWMNGGYASNLVKAINSSGMRRCIKELLDSGLMYVGSSAGSMIAGDKLDSAVWYPGGEDLGAQGLNGLGLVDFQIIPHYKDDYREQVEQNAITGETYYLLTDEQAIGVRDNDISFYGGKPRTFKVTS